MKSGALRTWESKNDEVMRLAGESKSAADRRNASINKAENVVATGAARTISLCLTKDDATRIRLLPRPSRRCGMGYWPLQRRYAPQV